MPSRGCETASAGCISSSTRKRLPGGHSAIGERNRSDEDNPDADESDESDDESIDSATGDRTKWPDPDELVEYEDRYFGVAHEHRTEQNAAKRNFAQLNAGTGGSGDGGKGRKGSRPVNQ